MIRRAVAVLGLSLVVTACTVVVDEPGNPSPQPSSAAWT